MTTKKKPKNMTTMTNRSGQKAKKGQLVWYRSGPSLAAVWPKSDSKDRCKAAYLLIKLDFTTENAKNTVLPPKKIKNRSDSCIIPMESPQIRIDTDQINVHYYDSAPIGMSF